MSAFSFTVPTTYSMPSTKMSSFMIFLLCRLLVVGPVLISVPIVCFTVPTTSSRPGTKMSAFMFFCFFSFSVAGALARAFVIKNRNCAKKVLCYRKTDTPVYDNFSREYLSQISSGNVCKTVSCEISKIFYLTFNLV